MNRIRDAIICHANNPGSSKIDIPTFNFLQIVECIELPIRLYTASRIRGFFHNK